MSDQAAAAVGPHVAAALSTRKVFAAARVECTGRDTADRWRVLAGVVPEHLTDHCRQLAELASTAVDP